MEITVYIPDESEGLLGEKPQEIIQAAVDAEITRLFHIDRCKPRDRGEKKPVGRPRIDPLLRHMTAEGEGIFRGLGRTCTPEEYQRVYQVWEDQFRALVVSKNVIALDGFLSERGWQRRGR